MRDIPFVSVILEPWRRRAQRWWQEIMAVRPTHIFLAWLEVTNKLISECLGCAAGKQDWRAARRSRGHFLPWALPSAWFVVSGCRTNSLKFLASAGGLFKDAKRENLLYYKGLFRSAATACEPKGSAALFNAFNLAIQIREKLKAPQEPVGCCFLFKAILNLQWNFSSSRKWRV